MKGMAGEKSMKILNANNTSIPFLFSFQVVHIVFNEP